MTLQEGISFFKSEIKWNIILILISIFGGVMTIMIADSGKYVMPILGIGLAITWWFISGMMIIVRNFLR